jgi:hypothetical protein
MYYLYDDFGRFAGTSETQTPQSTAVEPQELSAAWNWNHVGWVYAPNINPVALAAVVSADTPLG